eukprot:1130276-Prymnesium_polylepis.1
MDASLKWLRSASRASFGAAASAARPSSPTPHPSRVSSDHSHAKRASAPSWTSGPAGAVDAPASASACDAACERAMIASMSHVGE